MGKAQSKRSVDITTETKKGTEDEITEKMGKIEDLDKKEVVNGDATITEKSDHQEKMEEEVAENDKDMTTEKDVDVQASGDSVDPQNTTTETSKEDGGSAVAEEDISPLADESIKKSKKEKVKKKWSFRSISFGKKDKLKPAKSEEVAEDGSAAGNGGDSNEKTNESDDTKKDKSANENEEKTTETHENGNATPQELNEEQNGEKPSDNKTAHTTNTTTTETCEPVQKETAAVSSHLSEKTENTAVKNETKTSENATVGNGVDEKPQNAPAAASAEKISLLASAAINESSATTNGEVVDKIHQNGDHGESDQVVIEKSKAQIEVNSNTDNNVSAATLDSLSSTSISPSNVQTHVHDLKASSEVPDEIVQINNDEPVIETFTDSDINAIQTVDQSVDNELDVSTVEEIENIAQITEVFGATSSKTLDNEISSPEMLGIDSSPPPLPISPPPSQVSVFAFTNNEDTIQTKNFEPANNDLIEEEKTEMPLPSNNLPLTENDSSQEIGSIPVVVSATFDEKLISQEPDVQLQEDEVNINVEIKGQKNKIKEEEEEEAELTNLCKDLKPDTPMSSSLISKETNKIDEEASVAFAATVIEEITETAAEIVNQHLNCDTEQITDQLFAQNSENLCDEDEINNDNIIENYIEDKTQSDKDPDDHDLMSEDNKKKFDQLPLVIEQTNSKTIECSLDLTESNLIHQNEQEMNSVNMSNNLDELHLDPTKEFATAKDIKDNVTVAEVTQDLSVTCE